MFNPRLVVESHNRKIGVVGQLVPESCHDHLYHDDLMIILVHDQILPDFPDMLKIAQYDDGDGDDDKSMMTRMIAVIILMMVIMIKQ